MKSVFAYWRMRLLWSTYTGYAVFYFLRKNLSVAGPLMMTALGIEKSMLGLFFTLSDVGYGISKFIAGILADRFNPRYLMAGGLFLSVLANVAFGYSGAITVLLVLWVLNGCFQGFGFPPCARILSYWFAPRERGVMWGIFNTSHQVGAGIILVWAAWLGTHYGWQACFLVPAMVGLAVSIFLVIMVRDTPASLGLPSVEVYIGDRQLTTTPADAAPIGSLPAEPLPIGSQSQDVLTEDVGALVNRLVYRNPAIWWLCVGNFFLYVVRTGFLNWAPTYLKEVKGLSLVQAGAMTGGFEFAGLVGCLLSGWVSDRFMLAKRSPVCVLWMLMSSIFIFLFWKAPPGNLPMAVFYLCGVGFSVYGPQFLVGVMVADLSTKRAAGTAVGLSGLFGYMSSLISGYGLGSVATTYGWDGAFMVLIGCSLLSMIPFIICWHAAPTEED